ncbi:hypothetical protein GC176_17765 [bacterium]|nr:hypothetical protein [bacterium]
MTFIGKLLVIIQFVLTLCFMALAGAVYTSQANWKATAATLQTRVDQDTRDMQILTEEKNKEIDDLKKQLVETKNQADDARNDFVALQRQFDQQKTEVDRLKVQVNTQESLATIAGNEATIRRDEALLHRRINEGLNQAQNALNARVSQLEDENFNQQVELKDLSTRYNELLKTAGAYRRVLAANGFETDPKKIDRNLAPLPLVQGEVLKTEKARRGGREYVEISIGSDDGLTEGSTLYVYRTGDRAQYLGEIRLELVHPDKAVGIVVEKAKNGVIERKDYVTTKL